MRIHETRNLTFLMLKQQKHFSAVLQFSGKGHLFQTRYSILASSYDSNAMKFQIESSVPKVNFVIKN